MRARSRDLVGRKIVAINFQRFYDPEHGWCTDPILTLDNGRRVWIVTEETYCGEYGHAICIGEKNGARP